MALGPFVRTPTPTCREQYGWALDGRRNNVFPISLAIHDALSTIMRFALVLWCAAIARAQYSADETDVVAATEAIRPTQSTLSPAPTVSATVLFPSASSSWSHNGTAYLKYSLPDGVSPKSVSYVRANDNAGLLKAGNSKIGDLKSYFVYQKLMREWCLVEALCRCLQPWVDDASKPEEQC